MALPLAAVAGAGAKVAEAMVAAVTALVEPANLTGGEKLAAARSKGAAHSTRADTAALAACCPSPRVQAPASREAPT